MLKCLPIILLLTVASTSWISSASGQDCYAYLTTRCCNRVNLTAIPCFECPPGICINVSCCWREVVALSSNSYIMQNCGDAPGNTAFDSTNIEGCVYQKATGINCESCQCVWNTTVNFTAWCPSDEPIGDECTPTPC